MDGADGRYGYRAWDRRPGDDVDPSVALDAGQVIAEIAAQVPVPLPAGYAPRYLGYPRTEPTIQDVLGVGPSVLMQEKDTGQQGTLRNSTGAW